MPGFIIHTKPNEKSFSSILSPSNDVTSPLVSRGPMPKILAKHVYNHNSQNNVGQLVDSTSMFLNCKKLVLTARGDNLSQSHSQLNGLVSPSSPLSSSMSSVTSNNPKNNDFAFQNCAATRQSLKIYDKKLSPSPRLFKGDNWNSGLNTTSDANLTGSSPKSHENYKTNAITSYSHGKHKTQQLLRKFQASIANLSSNLQNSIILQPNNAIVSAAKNTTKKDDLDADEIQKSGEHTFNGHYTLEDSIPSTGCAGSSPLVPAIVSSCIKMIEHLGGLHQTGLYRIPGNSIAISQILTLLYGHKTNTDNNKNSNVICPQNDDNCNAKNISKPHHNSNKASSMPNCMLLENYQKEYEMMRTKFHEIEKAWRMEKNILISDTEKNFKVDKNSDSSSLTSCKEDTCEKWRDVNVIASVLKTYLRRLRDPLIPSDLYHCIIEANRLHSREERLQILKKFVHILPVHHYHTLKYVMKHLNLVTQYATQNKMNAKNLAIIFGPTIVRYTTTNNKNGHNLVNGSINLNDFKSNKNRNNNTLNDKKTVKSNMDINKNFSYPMHIHNTVVNGDTLDSTTINSLNFIKDMPDQCKIVELLITHYPWFFDDANSITVNNSSTKNNQELLTLTPTTDKYSFQTQKSDMNYSVPTYANTHCMAQSHATLNNVNKINYYTTNAKYYDGFEDDSGFSGTLYSLEDMDVVRPHTTKYHVTCYNSNPSTGGPINACKKRNVYSPHVTLYEPRYSTNHSTHIKATNNVTPCNGYAKPLRKYDETVNLMSSLNQRQSPCYVFSNMRIDSDEKGASSGREADISDAEYPKTYKTNLHKKFPDAFIDATGHITQHLKHYPPYISYTNTMLNQKRSYTQDKKNEENRSFVSMNNKNNQTNLLSKSYCKHNAHTKDHYVKNTIKRKKVVRRHTVHEHCPDKFIPRPLSIPHHSTKYVLTGHSNNLQDYNNLSRVSVQQNNIPLQSPTQIYVQHINSASAHRPHKISWTHDYAQGTQPFTKLHDLKYQNCVTHPSLYTQNAHYTHKYNKHAFYQKISQYKNTSPPNKITHRVFDGSYLRKANSTYYLAETTYVQSAV